MLLRSCFLPFLLALLPFSGSAQVAIGFRASANLVTLTASDEDAPPGLSNRFTVGFAVPVEVNLSPSLSFQFEPGYTQRGAQYPRYKADFSSTTDFYREGRIVLHYAELPLLLRFKPNVGPFRLLLMVGPELRYLTKGGGTFTETSYNRSDGRLLRSIEEIETFQKDDFNFFDYGLVGGAGVSVPMGLGSIFLDGRYHLGLGNFSKDPKGGSISNRGLSLNLGVLFNLVR